MNDNDVTNEERAADGYGLLHLQQAINKCIAQYDLPTKRPIPKDERHDLIVDIIANLMHAHGDPVDFDAAILSAKLHHQEETAAHAQQAQHDLHSPLPPDEGVVREPPPEDVRKCPSGDPDMAPSEGERQDCPDPVTDEELRSLPEGYFRSFPIGDGLWAFMWMRNDDDRDPREVWKEHLRSCTQKPSGGTKES